MTASQLQTESVVDRVYAAVRERIADGRLPGGARLRQEALAEELGVSRTPLREALRRLAAEGYVDLHPNRGAQVTTVDAGAVRRAYEARLVLEPGAARLAAIARPPGPLADLHDAVERQRDAGGPEAFQASRDFHLALVRASENDYLIRLAEALWVPGLARGIYERHRDAQERLLADVAEHQRIATAVAAGDADLAEALTRHHLAAALATMLRADAAGVQEERRASDAPGAAPTVAGAARTDASG